MRRSPIDYARLSLKGAAMGVADIVPGVSGGTIAFVTGIYEELIASLARIGPERFADWRQGGLKGLWRSINGSFLLAVFGGLLIALLSMAELIGWLLGHHRLLLWAFFFGLILASIPLVMDRMRRWQAPHLLWGAIGAGVGLGVTLLAAGSTPDALWMIFLAGLIAISAMVLPGISGSFLLLLMGQYDRLVMAVVERDLVVIMVFGTGAVIGILSVARLLTALFRRHHDATIALLTGFMLGSLNALWPWQHDESPASGLSGHYWPHQFEAATGQPPQLAAVILCFLLGIAVIAVFFRYDRKARARFR